VFGWPSLCRHVGHLRFEVNKTPAVAGRAARQIDNLRCLARVPAESFAPHPFTQGRLQTTSSAKNASVVGGLADVKILAAVRVSGSCLFALMISAHVAIGIEVALDQGEAGQSPK
jgi:hypothetical protein